MAGKGDIDTETERLGVDLPKKLKMEFAIQVRKHGATMTEIIEALVRAWLAGEIKLPEK